MGQSLFAVAEAPLVEAAPDVCGRLDALAVQHQEVLSDTPLYVVRADGDGDGWIALFDLQDGEEFDSRERSDARDAIVMDFLESCAGRPGLPEELFVALCEIVEGARMAFQETWDDGYVAYALEFHQGGVKGTTSRYQFDAEADEYELIDHAEMRSAPRKAPPKKAAPKKAAPKKAVGKKAVASMSGQTFMFTGTLATMTRAEAERIVKANGGTILSSVTDKLDYLVAGEKAGSKLAKAKKIPSVTILTEADFARLK